MYIIDRIKALKLIILFALINSSIFTAFRPYGISFLRMGIVLLLLVSVSLLFLFFFKKTKSYYYIHPYFKFIFLLVFLWTSFMIFRSLSFNSADLITLFGHYLMAWAWVTPLAIVFGINIFNWIDIFNFLSKLLFVGIILCIILPFIPNEDYGFGAINWLKFFPILFLTYFYQKPRNKKIILIAIIAFVIMSIVNSTRLNAIYLLLVLFFFSIEFFKYKHVSSYKKILTAGSLALILLFLSIQISTLSNNISNNKEATADTRTFLFVEMFNDMSDSELLVGRGVLGTYYSPYFDSLKRAGVEGGDAATRSVNEVAYLQMILKGGYIIVVLYLLILIPAAYLGIFKSKNIISKMSGYMIFIYLLLWTISYFPIYSAEFILLWMGVGTAISPTARKITDDELQKYMKRGNIIER